MTAVSGSVLEHPGVAPPTVDEQLPPTVPLTRTPVPVAPTPVAPKKHSVAAWITGGVVVLALIVVAVFAALSGGGTSTTPATDVYTTAVAAGQGSHISSLMAAEKAVVTPTATDVHTQALATGQGVHISSILVP